MTKAKRRDVVIFDTSAGWNLTGPNSNHDLDPFTSTPRNMTATSRNSTPTYNGMDALSHILGGRTNRINPASPMDVRIHTNCLPLRRFQSRIEVPAEEWTEA